VGYADVSGEVSLKLSADKQLNGLVPKRSICPRRLGARVISPSRPAGRDSRELRSYLVAMRRSFWSRVTALFVGLWFVAVTAAPEVTHACPMHGSHDATASPASGHDAHSSAVQSAAGHHSASTDSAPRHSTQCSCLGHCCSAPPVAVIATSVSLADVVTVATRDAGLPDYAYVPVAARHVLPLAHAPPLNA
jgi:hypothetical protein